MWILKTSLTPHACNCSACGDAAGTRSMNRPNMLFTICDAAGGSFIYSWSPPTYLDATNVPAPNALNILGPITYTVTVSGGKCTVIDTVTLGLCGPLPNWEMQFSGRQVEEEIELQWATSQIPPLSYFEIEKSMDGTDFSYLGSLSEAEYPGEFELMKMPDLNPIPGKNYYRLNLVGPDQAIQKSEIIEVMFSKGRNWLKLYPNPAETGNGIILACVQENTGNLQIEIFDLVGRKIRGQFASVVAGQNRIPVSLAGLPAGSYLVKVESESNFEVVRLVVNQ